MKSLCIILLVALLSGIAQSDNCIIMKENCRRTVYGTSNSWVQDANGIHLKVDISQYNFKKTPVIQTWLTCDGYCWYAIGASNVYSPKNTGFMVAVQYKLGDLQVGLVTTAAYNWVLNYKVQSMDDE